MLPMAPTATVPMAAPRPARRPRAASTGLGRRRRPRRRRSASPGRQGRVQSRVARQGPPHLVGRGRAVRRVVRQALQHDPIDFRRDGRVERRRRRPASRSAGARSTASARRASNGRRPGEQFVREHAEGVHVGALGDRPAAQLLRGLVRRGAAVRVHPGHTLGRGRQPEVGQPARPRPSTITFAGFRSRWTSPSSWTACSPARTCRARSMASPRRQPAGLPQHPGQVVAGMNSMLRNACPSASPMSYTRQTCGWATCRAAATSLRKRSSRPGRGHARRAGT